MTTFSNYLPQSLVLAGTLSLANAAGCGSASPTATENPALASASASSSSAAAPRSSSSAVASASSSATAYVPTPSTETDPLAVQLQGRAGIATMCIETRSYVDPQTGKIITPSIYIDKMPAEGIDTLYKPGSPAEQKWNLFLNPTDEKRKQWLSDTDIPAQAKAAFELVKKLDKDKDGIITAAEFEKGEKGVSKEDLLIDLAFLTSLRCDNLFLNEGPLNVVNPEEFPTVQGLRAELAATKAAAKKKIEDTQAELEQTKYAFYGTSLLSGLLAAGLIASKVRNRRSQKAEGGKTTTQPVAATTTPSPTRSENTATPSTAAPATNAQAQFDDILSAIEDAPASTPQPPAGGATPPPLPGGTPPSTTT